jgi:hypothetical protein
MEPTAETLVLGLVWYAAYGSNLSWARFHTYLSGGPVPHSPVEGRTQAGSRNTAPPIDDRPWWLPFNVYFAGSPSGWGGGAVAFLDTERAPGTPDAGPVDGPLPAAGAPGRIWLLSVEQFEDVFRQEDGQRVPDLGSETEPLLDPFALAPHSHLDIGSSRYGRVVHLGPGPDDRPVLTFTAPDSTHHRRGAAHPSYARTVGLGLIETWGMSPTEAAQRVAACDGNRAEPGRPGLDAEALALDLDRFHTRP